MGEILRKPPWIRRTLPSGEDFLFVDKILKKLNLYTVCREAKCPNISECWSKKEATIMILGNICTRFCKFCAVRTGNPKGFVDYEEPKRVGEAVRILKLKYVVITSVDRDDLEDGGAEIFKKTIESIKISSPGTKVEPLVPDFRGEKENIKKIIEAGPDVVAHNIETVERLTPWIRDKKASYSLSLSVLEKYKKMNMITKTGFMVGLGEKEEDILKTLKDLKDVGVDILTVGQYLQPTKKNIPVKEYYSLEKFKWIKEEAENMGMVCISGPFVRSSYKAREAYLKYLQIFYSKK